MSETTTDKPEEKQEENPRVRAEPTGRVLAMKHPCGKCWMIGTELAVSLAASGNLKDGDAITVHIRNRGNTAVIIEKVKVFGATYQQNAKAACSTTVPAQGTFLMIDDDTIASTATPLVAALSDCNLNFFTIGPNAEATLIVRYDTALNGDAEVKIGRPIPVVIQTANGGAFIKQLQNGVRL